MTVKSGHIMASPSAEKMADTSCSSATVTVAQPVSVTDRQTCSLSPEQKERVRRRMLERLISTSAHFAHQQRDAPDLTQQEKVDIAGEILLKNPATFLARFGKFLQSSDLAFFRDTDKDNYEVHFYLSEIQHRCTHSDVIIKNRRYSAMKELEEGGEYFSEEQMKRREPLLYEQMIGQHLTEEELQQQTSAAIDRSDLRFSTILMVHMDDAQRRALYKYQKEKEDCQDEEEEEDSEEEEEEEDEENDQQQAEMEDEEEDAEDVPEISDVRATGILRQQLREEFRAIMHEKFLSGDDAQFDYSKVDDNPDYDSLTVVSQDAEHKYFLSEAPETVKQDSSGNDSNRNPARPAPTDMEEGGGEEEEEDYMMYEPPADLVAKSTQYVRTGSWTDQEDCPDG